MFADRVKKLREEKGLTQTELSEQIGIDQSQISKYERGERAIPTTEHLGRLADFFNVSTDYLLGRINNRQPGESVITARKSTPSTAVANAFQRMTQRRRLRGVPQIVVFTGGALTADEIRQLEKGFPPSFISEERLVQFLRKFDLDDIREYYRAAGMPLPQAFQDLEADLREILHRVRMSTDGSPEALEFVIQLAKESFEEDGEKKKK